MSLESSTPKLELIQVADVVAREKGIQRDEVIEAMEQAIQKAGREKNVSFLKILSVVIKI